MSSEKVPGSIHLVGVSHHLEIASGKGAVNYESVKRYLEQVKPAFVTLEMQLSELRLKYSDIPELLRLPLDELDRREQELLADVDTYSGENLAAVIYCRRNNIPLYFVDLFDIPPDKLAQLDMTRVDPASVWTPARQITSSVMWASEDFDKRNAFMSQAINLIASNFPNRHGVHIGGANHIIPGARNTTLMDTITIPVAERIRLTQDSPLAQIL